jgi:NhaP-type Na+/H+ or K+/H+ antiporter
MGPVLWYLIVGSLLLLMVLLQSAIRRLPVSPAIIYLLIGVGLGPELLGLIEFDSAQRSAVLEMVTEIAVSISLFSVGLKIRLGLDDRAWRLALRLAVGSMLLTIGAMSAIGVLLLGLPLGAAILLAAILAPTDPVLASEVQLRGTADRDRVRFGLTAEGGLNDGMAFPFVMLGLGLLGLHELGGGIAWLTTDVLWAISVGLASGWACGRLMGRLVLFLRRGPDTAGLDEFLGLGLMALSYGCALALHGYAFLAVFAAGLGVRGIAGSNKVDEDQRAGERPAKPSVVAERSTRALLSFNQQLENIVEVGTVLILGAMLRSSQLTPAVAGLAALLFLVVRPASVYLGLAGAAVPSMQTRLLAWFGIRGIGSLYYLVYAVNHGLPPALAEQLAGLVLPVLAASILVHGISATPLMEYYHRKRRRLPAAGV